MKLFLKKFAFIGFISLFFLGLVACDPTEETATDLEKVQAVLASITLDNLTAVTEDLTLPTPTTDGVTVTWSSNNADVISNSGEVTIPSFATGDVAVVLTVTATLNEASETKTFNVTVSAEDATAFFTRVGASVIIDGSDSITEGFLLPGTVQGATIVWASSNTDVVTVSETVDGDGFYTITVNRPKADDGGTDTTVTITGTITYGDASGSVTKTIRVKAEQSAAKVATIAEGMALGVGEYVNYQGMTVIGIGTNGFFFTDGTDIMYVYGAALASQVEIGNVYDVTGSLKWYYFAPELDVNGDNVCKVAPSTAAAVDYPYTTATVAEVLEGRSIPAENGDIAYTMYRLTAKVYVGADLDDGYDVFLVPADYDTSVKLDLSVTPALRVYYQGNLDTVRALKDQVITLDFMLFAYHSTHVDWYGFFFGTASDIQVAFDNDADAVAAALDGLQLPSEVLAATTLDLPASLYGVTLSYSSDNETVINSTTGVVDLSGLTSQATVIITVNAVKGEASGSTTFTIKVGETPLTDIATAIANVNNTVKFQGIVTKLDGNNAYVQDSTGGTYLYVGSSTDYAEILVIGNLVEVEGKMVNYKNLLEVSPVSVVTVVSSGNDLPTALDVTADFGATLAEHIGELVNLSNFYVKSLPSDVSKSYTVYLTNGTEDVQLRVDSYGEEFDDITALVGAWVVGQKVSFENIVVGAYNSPQLMWLEVAELTASEVSDQIKVEYDALKIPATLELESDYTLPTLTFATLTIKEISSELTNYVSDGTTALTVVVPEAADVSGTVTFTLTLGDVVVDKVVNVTVKAVTEAQKLAYDADQVTLPTTANVFDSFDAPVAGVKGSTIVWAITAGSENAAIADEVLSLGFSDTEYTVTVTATLSLGSETPVVKTFTITVSPITIVTDFSTLTAQTEGAWTVTDGTNVYVQGVVTGVAFDGTFIQDEAGNGLFLYKQYSAEVGDQVVVYGALASYRSARQLGSGNEVKVVLATGKTFAVNAVSLDDVIALTYADAGKLYKVTGVSIYSIDSSKVIFKVTGSSSVQYLRLYYQDFAPWLGDLFAVNDVLPEIQFTFYNIYTTNVAVDGDTFNIDMFSMPGMTEAQFVTAALGSTGIPEAITADTTLSLPTEVYGVALSYASSDDLVFNATTGVVTVNPAQQVTVTITVTGTLGSTTDSAEITVKVGVTPVSTVAQVSAVADDSVVKIQVVITSDAYNYKGRNFFGQDATGGIDVYVNTGDTDLIALLAANVGKVVEIEGTKTVYNGLLEIYPTSVTVVGDPTTAPTPVDLTGLTWDTTTMAPYQGLLISISNLIVTEITTYSSGDTYIYLDSATGVSYVMYFDSDVTLSTEAAAALAAIAEGDIINITSNLDWNYNGPRFSYTNTTVVADGTLTEQEKLDYDALDMTVTEFTLTEDMDYPTFLFSTFSVVSIDSALTSYVTDDAANSIITVVRPAAGLADAVGNVVVRLTVGGVSQDFTIAVTVSAEVAATDQLAYTTGFESPDFSATNTYNNATENLIGPTGLQWSVLSGTPSTTSPLVGLQSLQGRDYDTDSVIPTFTTAFTVTDVTRVVFTAANSNTGYDVEVSISVDGVTWTDAEVFTLSTTATEFTYEVTATGSIYIRFTQVVPSTTVNKARLYLDEVSIYKALD